ncbi:MAG: type III polyketide synthase [Phycisphaerales bacterium]
MSLSAVESRRASKADRPSVAPSLAGIGSALPERRWAQRELAALQADLWSLRGAELDRWQRIVERSGIEHRSIVGDPTELPSLSTAARMERFEEHAPPLARDAARRALEHAGCRADEVTDLVIVTCTGFRAPGLASDLIGDRGIGLPATVRPLQLGFMGCFGGIAALRAAGSIAAADPQATVLAICVELCSLHLRGDRDPQNLVASALFADGAAAAVVRGIDSTDAGSGPRLGRGRSLTLPEGRDEMTWRITDHGFAMTLSREVPVLVRRRLAGLLESASPEPRAVLPHPGGPGILEAVESSIASSPLAERIDPRGLVAARSVLRDCGNLSSATILLVIERAIEAGVPLPAEAVAFGPGLAIDAIGLLAPPRPAIRTIAP